MARDWEEPYRIARQRLLEARRNGSRPQFNPTSGLDAVQQAKDAEVRQSHIAPPTPTTPTDGVTQRPKVVRTPFGRKTKVSPGRGNSVVFGSQPGTKAFYREKQVQPPEPYIERVDDFGEGGGIRTTILSGKTGEELKDQRSGRRRMTQRAVRRHAKELAKSVPAVEAELP